MALIVKDRVKETTSTIGQGTITLAGASTGFQSFAAIGDGNDTYYTIVGQGTNEWEVGLGRYTASGTTLSRTTVLSNSSGTQPTKIDFSAGTKDVFVTYPSDKAILGDISAVSSTGTGSVVLSNSPALTGDISANVNLRADTLANLLPLAAGASEIGYATDANALVRFNGTAGQAQIITGGSTLNFTLNASNIANLTNPASGVYIDCNNISYLNIIIDPAIVNTTNQYNNLNIKLPNSQTTPNFTVYIPFIRNTLFWDSNTVQLTLAFQAADISAGMTYFPIAADIPAATGPWNPSFKFANYMAVEINFIAQIMFGLTSDPPRWTRLPLAGEGAYNLSNNNVASIGSVISASGTTQTLSSGTVANSSTLTLTTGLWLVTGYVTFNVTSDVVATEIMAGIGGTSTTSVPTNSATTSMVRTTQNLPTAGNITFGFAPIILTATVGTTLRYGNARATFSAGTTITANVSQRAIRLG